MLTINEESVYLNNASTTYPKCNVATKTYMDVVNGIPFGARDNGPDDIIEQARTQMAKTLGVAREHVFFSYGATLAINQVILGHLQDGQACAVDNRSHSAVIRPLFANQDRFKVKIIDLYDREDNLQFDALERQIDSAVKLVCLTHVSNVNGSVYELGGVIKAIRTLCPDTAILVDASQAAGCIVLDDALKADFVIFPSHKHLHSVPGAAVLIAKKQLKPLIGGGTGYKSYIMDMSWQDQNSVEVGTMNYPAIFSMAESYAYAVENMEKNANHENRLLKRLYDGINQIKSFKILGRKPGSNRVGILCCDTLMGLPEIEWANYLRANNIYVRAGLHCSPLHHRQLGLMDKGTLRFSLGWYNTEQDIDAVLEKLGQFSYAMEKLERCA